MRIHAKFSNRFFHLIGCAFWKMNCDFSECEMNLIVAVRLKRVFEIEMCFEIQLSF